MKKSITIVFLILAALFLNESKAYGQTADLEKYNVIWNSPGNNSSGSMPIGNGDVGMNLWVEENGDLVFYISKTDAWDENGRLCKIGRVRVKFNPTLSVTDGFRQELKLRDGMIEIKSKINNQPSTIRLWVDANQPVVHVEAESGTPVNCRAEVELWRLSERPFAEDDDSHSSRGLILSDFKPTVLPDVVVPSKPSKIVWYHRNTRSIYDLGLKTQHLENLNGEFTDPLLNLIFGASLKGDGFIPDGKQALRSAVAVKQQSLSITVLTSKSETAQAWIAQMEQTEQKTEKLQIIKARVAHQLWWKSFWNRSWIFIDGAPETATVTRGYVLQRFMTACAGRGGSPIKFNGSIFTNEPKPGDSPEIGRAHV